MQRLIVLTSNWLLYPLLLCSLIPCIIYASSPTTQQEAVVTFSVTGIGSDVLPDAFVLTVDGVDYRALDLPLSFTWDVGSQHTYQWADYVLSTNESKRYTWQSTSGIVSEMKGVLVVPENGGLVLADYKVQYQWVIAIEGIGLDAPATAIVDGVYMPARTPLIFWWDENSQHTYCFKELVLADSSYKRCAYHEAGCFDLVVSGPGTLIGLYHVEYRIYIWPGRGRGTTEPNPGEYWVDNGTYMYITAIPEEGYIFEEWTDMYSECSTYERYSNPTKLLVCGPIVLRAHFREIRPFDFNVLVEPSRVYVYKGGSAILGVVVLSEGDFPQAVSLSISNLPRGVSYSFGVESAVPPLSTTLTIVVSEEVRAGTYTIVLSATSGNITKNYSLLLTILEYEKPWYMQLPLLALLVTAVLIPVLILVLHRKHVFSR